MEFTKEQIFELTSKHLEKENGIQDLLEIMLESIMLAERREFLSRPSYSEFFVSSPRKTTANVRHQHI